MIDHISIYVSNLERSKLFYQEIFGPMGYQIVFGEEGKFWAFQLDNNTLFEIIQTNETLELNKTHIAFRAKDQNQVDIFYENAIKAGGKCNGKPGLRPLYAENYYATFIMDPDSYNIEAVFNPINS